MLYNRDGLEILSFTTNLFTGFAKETHLQNEDVVEGMHKCNIIWPA